ncbi:MAG: FtsX-like permease family protein, partial [Bacteroidota bacterium]
ETDVQKVEAKMIPFGEKAAAELAKFNLPFKPTYFLQPLTDIHLHSNINFESGQPGDIRYLYLAMSIAFIILLLALINYMNLATARTSQRSKEVGVRKVLGAERKQLINQFMMEATLLTGVSLGLAVFFAKWLMPTFNQLMNLDISFNLSDNPWIFFGLATIATVLSVSSGLYPAILSTAIGPVKALKGNWWKNRNGGGTLLRSSLVVGQFTAAIVLGISSVVIYQQLQYIQTKKLGFNREQILFVPFGNQPYLDKAATLRSELQKHPNIENVTISSDLPINTNNQGLASDWEGKTANDKQLHIYRMRTDYHFFDVFEMELVEGRNFSPNFPTDSSGAYILNEAAVEAVGWESAVGKSFMDGRVVGVVKNFHFQPFDLVIEPMYISLLNHNNAYNNGNIVMKAKLEDSRETTVHIEQTLKNLFPELICNINHLDDAYNNLYQSEQRFGDAFNIFTLIALFIACIGLFGLVTHSVLLRTKEIGIRKVLGASVGNIVRLISKDFLKLVVLSAVIAIPLAWWSMNTWLQDFAYRIDLNWFAFTVVGLVAILIAFLTVGFQSLKAALANPIETIQSE